MFDRLLSRKIEAWVLLVVVLAGLVLTLLFGMAVHDISTGKRRLGPLTPAVRSIVRTHIVLKEAFLEVTDPARELRATEDRFAGLSGFDPADAAGPAAAAPYLLLNRYDADRPGSVTELVDLETREVLHRWVYDVDPIWRRTGFSAPNVDLAAGYHTRRFRGVHALLTPAGEIVTQGMNTPLLKFGLCGDLLWEQTDLVYHHSIETDAEGNYWASARYPSPRAETGIGWLREDVLAQVSPAGELLHSRSVIEILVENGLDYLVYGQGFADGDPLHLNDIQPVLADGPLWKRGDLFLSIRNLALVALYRPSTGELLWHRVGPWLNQHDVNILDDHRISVFDNNARAYSADKMVVNGVNRIAVVDLADDSLAFHMEGPLEALGIRTEQQGRGEILADGRVFVEETQYGRLALLRPDGRVDWTYVNRAGDGAVYWLNWSRLVSRATGDAVREKLSDNGCDP